MMLTSWADGVLLLVPVLPTGPAYPRIRVLQEAWRVGDKWYVWYLYVDKDSAVPLLDCCHQPPSTWCCHTLYKLKLNYPTLAVW